VHRELLDSGEESNDSEEFIKPKHDEMDYFTIPNIADKAEESKN
jgi:hypothetical protein